MNDLFKKVEDNPEDALTEDLDIGNFTGHPNKLICYIDLLGISAYYQELDEKTIEEVKSAVDKKLLQGFLDIVCYLKKEKGDIYSFHIISDTIIIVPKSEPKNNKEIPTIKDFFKEIIFHCYEKLRKMSSQLSPFLNFNLCDF